MPYVPPQEPTQPPGIIPLPTSPGPKSKLKFSALLYEMFGAISSLYAFLTQDTLKGLNATLRFYSDQENIIAGKLSHLQGLKCPNQHMSAITKLKNLQQQVQVQIQLVQSTISGVSAGVATMASQLMGINQSVYQAMQGITSQM